MFTVKHAIMEILNKSKSLDEVLAVLNAEDQAILLTTFDLMKAKLGGAMDSMETQDNGQWTLVKNTLDYSKMNAPKVDEKPEPVRTIDYSSPAMRAQAKNPMAGSGAIARRDAALAAHKKRSEVGAPKPSPAGEESGGESALQAIQSRQAKKSEDQEVQQIKDKYADKQPKPLDQAVAEVKERFTPKSPKSDEEKADEAKKKFREESKLKADQPIKSNIETSKR